ncbi:MAG TPA: tetratricopeptide repeat protein, partial [Candidatus Baltobacteraceae bacterium]|nr:tetratricopeptide repeat protein [Candidatus Baltobacteraceae bacterium]
LILDNCEHLIAQVRIVSAAIIQDAPQVHVLATSREGLNIRGERVFRMPSLPTDAAVMLFTDRALAANVHFSLTEENAPFVEEICHRLDGIPLALELAAARVKVLSPQQLARKLDERFRLLTGGDRSALPRQQTMRALIDWSYDLLSEDERAVFRKLAIFAGGFTLETAAAVCGDERIDEMALLDLLSSLVDKSLVQADLQGGGTRYRLLESMRQYAHEKLAESGEGYTTAAAHATAFVALAEELDRRYENTPDASWYAQLEPEIDNWRAALEWTLGTEGDVRLGQQLAGALNDVWSVVAPAEGRRWIRTALESVDALTAPTVVAKLNLAEAYADSLLGQHKAADAAAQAALAKYREVGDELGVARAQRSSGRSLVLIGRVEEGEAILHQALLAARTLRAPKLTGLTLEGLAHARAYSEDVPAARAYYQQAIAASNAAGAELQSARTMSNLAECEFRAGDAATAVALAREALLLRRTSNDIRGVANTLCNIAGYLVALHRVDEARAASREALELARDTQAEVLKIFTLQHLGAIAACQSDYVRAGQLLGYVNVRLEGLQAMREYTEQHEYEQVVAVLADVLGKAELQNLINQGGEWSEDHALSEAMLV